MKHWAGSQPNCFCQEYVTHYNQIVECTKAIWKQYQIVYEVEYDELKV